MPEEIKRFKEIIKDEMKAKGMNMAKLSEATDVSINYIKALIDEDMSSLPSAPYVRGYLQKISRVLGLDFDLLWEEYKKEENIKKSGKNDTLPTNRYEHKPLSKKWIVVSLMAIVVIVIIFPKIESFFGKPDVEIISPQNDNLIVDSSIYTLKGRIENPKDKALINGEEVEISDDGLFKKSVNLDEGINTFQFQIKRFLGKSSYITRNIIYQKTTTEILNYKKN